MAKPSRSKQPEFDPRELEDLIFSPAVGTGVGSHLVRGAIDMTTVAINDTTTVVRNEDPLFRTSDLEHLPTVDMPGDVSTVVMPHLPTVATPDLPTVDTLPFWRTESGDLVPHSRVRRIRLAQDVLNSAEESVYDALWNAKGAIRGEGDAWRIAQAGYDALVKRTRLSRKTIQRIVEKLLHKDFIAIEKPADIYKRTSTTYRVFSYRTVLELQAAKGRTHAVKIGPGFVFAERLQPADDNMTTVATTHPATVANMTTPTVVKNNLPTVVSVTTLNIEQNNREQSSSSGGWAERGSASTDDDDRVIAAARRHGIVFDRGIARRLIDNCRVQEPGITAAEITELLDRKVEQLRNSRSVENWPALLAIAVPRMVPSPEFSLLREQRKAVETRSREVANAVLADPDASAEERDWARAVLGQ